MKSANELKSELAQNGFVLFKGFFDSEQVKRAHDELNLLFDEDAAERSKNQIQTVGYDGSLGRSFLFKAFHLLTEVYGKSPTLDQLFDKILTDPTAQEVLKFLAGDHIKMRGYNVRRMSGEIDPPPGLEWHRDNLGEIGFGILLTDVEPGFNASTSFIPGSHLYPINAQHDCLFLMPYEGNHFFLRHNVFSKILEKRILTKATSAWGKRGDFYIFINDSWHGRFPNLHGAKSMVFLAGAFPTEFPFPSHGTVTDFPQDVIEKLPRSLQQVLAANPPLNNGKDSYLYQMYQDREKLRFFSVWNFAKIERRLADLMSLSHVKKFARKMIQFYVNWIRPVLLPIAKPLKRIWLSRKTTT